VSKCSPNPGHYALVDLEDLLPQVVIVTQNVDGFHQMVGSTDVICLHGDIRKDKCFANCQGTPTYADITQLAWDKESGPPICPHCETAYLRPDVVWFEEALPHAALQRAVELSQQADVMLVIGTKGAVYPAALLPLYAKEAGATVLEINPQESDITYLAKHWLPMPSGEAMPQIVELIRKAKSA
jgi:NAD-dependent deacetylase